MQARNRRVSRLHPALATAMLLVAACFGSLAQDGSPGPKDTPPGSEEPECIVTLKGGGQMIGRLVEETDTEVVVRVGEVLTTFGVDEIDRLVLAEPVLDRYRRMRRTIDDADAPQRLMLAEWLMVERQYRLALKEVRGVLEFHPSNQRARELELLLDQQVKLLQSARPDAPQDQDSTDERIAAPEFPLLSPEQINLLRVYEVDLTNPPKMSVSRETIEQLLTYYADDERVPRNPEQRRALLRQRAEKILALLFDLRARELYGEVRIEEDPEALRRFRVDVHNSWLLRGCATNRCHGGQEAGRLYLANARWRADQTVYTNFLILDRFRTEQGERLINYEEPERSLLLELAPRSKDQATR